MRVDVRVRDKVGRTGLAQMCCMHDLVCMTWCVCICLHAWLCGGVGMFRRMWRHVQASDMLSGFSVSTHSHALTATVTLSVDSSSCALALCGRCVVDEVCE